MIWRLFCTFSDSVWIHRRDININIYIYTPLVGLHKSTNITVSSQFLEIYTCLLVFQQTHILDIDNFAGVSMSSPMVNELCAMVIDGDSPKDTLGITISLDWFKGKSTGNHGFYH